MKQVHLYRLFDFDGNLLYVGTSYDSKRRLRQHRTRKHWFEQVARVETESFPTKEAASAAEVAAIRAEGPKYNHAYNTGFDRPTYQREWMRAHRAKIQDEPVETNQAALRLSDEQFRNGQASFQRGVGLRTIAEEFGTLMDGQKEAEAFSLGLGYLDGVIAAIRRTDNLLMFPAGPDK